MPKITPTKLPLYLNHDGSNLGLTWRQFFGKGNLLGKNRLVFLGQWGVGALACLFWLQHGHSDVWARVFKKK